MSGFEKIYSTGMKRLLNHLISTDPALYDFHLFGYLKMMLEGKSFDTPVNLFREAREILEKIPKSTLARAYDEWMRRLQVCIEQKGNYI